MEKLELELTRNNTVIEGFETPPDDRLQGGEEPDIQADKIRMYIGTRPFAFNLKKLYKKLGKEIPPEIQIFKSYDAYILNHSVGVIKEGGIKKINQIGYLVNFPDDIEILVLDTMPQTKFISKIEGNFQFQADLNLNGELTVPDSLTKLIAENIENVGIGGKLKASTVNSIVGRFSFAVVSPEIQSVGKGSKNSEWVFNKGDKELYGDDIEMFQIILVDRFVKEISFKVRLYTTISTFNFLPIRRESAWQDISCKLD